MNKRPSGVRIINSRDLLKDSSVAYIEHEGKTYILRKTKERKLILTK